MDDVMQLYIDLNKFMVDNGSLVIYDYARIFRYPDFLFFYCEASNVIGRPDQKYTATIRSRKANVSITSFPGFTEETDLVIVDVAIGSNVALKCPINTSQEYNPPPIFEWFDNYYGRIDPNNDTDNMFYLEGGLYLAIIEIKMDQVSSGRRYWCRVLNAWVYFTQYSPEFAFNIRLPEDTLVEYKQIGNVNAFITVSEIEFSYIGGSNGTGNPGIFAFCELFDGDNDLATLSNNHGIGTISMNQIIPHLSTTRNEFTIQCQIGYSGGAAIRTGNLRVYQRAIITSSPQSNREFVTGSGNLVFTCNAEGIPSPEIAWYFNGNNTFVPNSRIRIIGDTMIIAQPSPSHSGIYQCFASNEFGTDMRAWNLEVEEPMITVTGDLTESRPSTGTTVANLTNTNNTAALTSAIIGVVCSLVFYIGGVISGFLIYYGITRCKHDSKLSSDLPRPGTSDTQFAAADQAVQNNAYYESIYEMT